MSFLHFSVALSYISFAAFLFHFIFNSLIEHQVTKVRGTDDDQLLRAFATFFVSNFDEM